MKDKDFIEPELSGDSKKTPGEQTAPYSAPTQANVKAELKQMNNLGQNSDKLSDNVNGKD